MSPGFGGIVFQNGEAAGEMDLFWILISCCNSTIYRFFCLRLVKFLSEKLSQKSTFTGKINPLNFLKSQNICVFSWLKIGLWALAHPKSFCVFRC